MIKIQDMIECITGSPQSRIEVVPYYVNAPLYNYYSQTELENDLRREESKNTIKQVKTLDSVNIVKADDIIFSLLTGKASLVSEKHSGYIFTQNYVKLVPKRPLYSKYLIFLLNENNSIKKQLNIGLQGSATLKYTVKQIKELILPDFPPIDRQQIIGELYFNQLRLQALKERTAKLESIIILKKIKEVCNHERSRI